MMALYAGIDGGGSKTLVVVVDETGQEVGRAVEANANYQVLMAQGHSDNEAALLVAQRLKNALLQAVGARNSESLRGIFAGLAGLDRPQDVVILQSALARVEVCEPAFERVTNDAELILYGLEHGVGIGLIAGTGSIAFGHDLKGQGARAGGWGHILGDEGSGYAVGLAALQACTQAADKRSPATALLPTILNAWNLASPANLFQEIYSNDTHRHQRIARLASLVFELAPTDEIAAQLATQAAHELAKAVWAVYQQLDFDGDIAPALGLGGGLLLNTPLLQIQVLARLQEWGYQPRQIVAVHDPALAAARACLQEYT